MTSPSYIDGCKNCSWYCESQDWCYNPDRQKCDKVRDYEDHKHGIK